MQIIDIPIDFTDATGFRTYDDGLYSGQEFFEKKLKPKFALALQNNEKLRIILDGGEGYTSSFLNEAFRLLAIEYGADGAWERLEIISDEIPKYTKKIQESIYEKVE